MDHSVANMACAGCGVLLGLGEEAGVCPHCGWDPAAGQESAVVLDPAGAIDGLVPLWWSNGRLVVGWPGRPYLWN